MRPLHLLKYKILHLDCKRNKSLYYVILPPVCQCVLMLSEMNKQLLEPICRLKYQFLKKKVKKIVFIYHQIDTGLYTISTDKWFYLWLKLALITSGPRTINWECNSSTVYMYVHWHKISTLNSFKKKMNFSLCLCECKLYKLENQDDKNFDKKNRTTQVPCDFLRRRYVIL